MKETLRAGGVSMGVMCMEFATTGIGRLSAEAGAEFAVFDMEHTGWSLETIKMLVATSRSGRPRADRPPAGRPTTTSSPTLMDVGAMGLVIPLVNSAEQIAVRRSSARSYPPRGKRGCAFAMAHDDYKGGDLAAKMRHANDNVLMIAQIETAEGLANVDAIAGRRGRRRPVDRPVRPDHLARHPRAVRPPEVHRRDEAGRRRRATSTARRRRWR